MKGRGKGWREESQRHRLAGMGIKTSKNSNNNAINEKWKDKAKCYKCGEIAKPKIIDKKVFCGVCGWRMWNNERGLDNGLEE